MTGILQDIRFALRLLNRRRGFAATAILTLALGIGVNVTMFSVVDGVLIRRLPFPSPDRLVRVGEMDGTNDPIQPFSAGNFLDVQRQTNDVFQALAAYRVVPAATLTGVGEAVKAGTLAVRPEFFDVLGVPPTMGRPLIAADVDGDARSVVVSAAFWRGKLGADPHAINRDIELDGQRWTVVGVMPEGIEFPSGVELWKPLLFTPADIAARNSWNLQVVGRLKAGVSAGTADAAAKRAMALVENGGPGRRRERSAAVVDLRDDLISGVRRDLLFVQAIAVVVLLIACANLANLLLASATTRVHEFSIRGSLGAGRWRLARQLLAESLALSCLGGAAGAALAYLIVPAVVAAYPGTLPGREHVGVGFAELVLALAAAIATSVVFGFAPAVVAARTTPSVGLRAHERAGTSPLARWLRNGLVAVEVCLALSLLAGALLLTRSFAALVAQPTGFDATGVIAAYLQVPTARYPAEADRRRVFETMVDRLASDPAVEHAAYALPMPFDGSGMGMMLRWDPALGIAAPASGSARWVSPGYLEVLSIPLRRGRFFTRDDRAGSPPVAVVNDAFARQHGKGRDVVGMRLVRSDGEPLITIVGIIADVRANFFQTPRSEILFPLAQTGMPAGNLIVKLRGPAGDFAARVRQVARDVVPNVPMGRIDPLADVIGTSVSRQRFDTALLGSLSTLALLLSAVGIYGVMAYVVSQRRREMGIRLALGAHPSQVRSLVVRQGVVPILIGLAGGLAGAWFLTTLLKKELYEVQPHDPSTLAASTLAFLVIGVVACWIPARRGSRVNPVEVLRSE